MGEQIRFDGVFAIRRHFSWSAPALSVPVALEVTPHSRAGCANYPAKLLNSQQWGQKMPKGGNRRSEDNRRVDRHVGSRLRTRRTMLGMSQSTLAKAVGLTFQQVQKYERGTNRISASKLYQFGQIVGVPVAFFFEGLGAKQAGERELSSEKKDPMFKRETLELVRAISRIKDSTARKALANLIFAAGRGK